MGYVCIKCRLDTVKSQFHPYHWRFWDFKCFSLAHNNYSHIYSLKSHFSDKKYSTRQNRHRNSDEEHELRWGSKVFHSQSIGLRQPQLWGLKLPLPLHSSACFTHPKRRHSKRANLRENTANHQLYKSYMKTPQSPSTINTNLETPQQPLKTHNKPKTLHSLHTNYKPQLQYTTLPQNTPASTLYQSWTKDYTAFQNWTDLTTPSGT